MGGAAAVAFYGIHFKLTLQRRLTIKGSLTGEE